MSSSHVIASHVKTYYALHTPQIHLALIEAIVFLVWNHVTAFENISEKNVWTIMNKLKNNENETEAPKSKWQMTNLSTHRETSLARFCTHATAFEQLCTLYSTHILKISMLMLPFIRSKYIDTWCTICSRLVLTHTNNRHNVTYFNIDLCIKPTILIIYSTMLKEHTSQKS